MSNNHEAAPLAFVKHWLKVVGIEVNPKMESVVVATIANHVEALLYNVSAVTCTLTMLTDARKIQPKHLKGVRVYIQNSCSASSSHQKGGTSMPSDYFGYPNPNYTSSAGPEGLVMSEVSFNEGIARPALGPQEGGGKGSAGGVPAIAAHASWAKAFVRGVLKLNGMTISTMAFKELMHMMDIHLKCAATDLKEVAPLTAAKTARVFGMKRHAVFN